MGGRIKSNMLYKASKLKLRKGEEKPVYKGKMCYIIGEQRVIEAVLIQIRR